MLANGFYEWKKARKSKIPIYIVLKSREPVSLAGLWEAWEAPVDEEIHSSTITTTTPNSLMKSIHNRMPA